MKQLHVILLFIFIFSLCSAVAQRAEIDSLEKALSQKANDTAKVNAFLAVSKRFFSHSPGQAIIYANKARELAEKLHYKRGVANAYKNIGIAHYWEGEYVDAIHNYQKSMALFDTIGDKTGIANIQSNLGAIYFDQSDNDKALEYYLQSLKTSEEVGDTFRIITACVNIGAVYADKPKTYDKALEYFMRALPLGMLIRDSASIGMTTVNIGEVYFKKGEDTLALEYFKRSVGAFENSENLPYSLNYIGRVYQKRKEYKQALQYHQQAYDYAGKSDSKLDMAQSLLGLAQTLQQTGNIAQAIVKYKQAEEVALPVNLNQELKDIYDGLANSYSAQHDYANAFKYQTELGAIKDTLYNIDADKKLQGLQFTFDLEKKESKIKLLTKEEEIDQQILARQKLVRNGFIGGFAITLLFAGIFFRQRNRITKEKKRSDELLLNILPEETAEELKETGTAKTKSFSLVSVLFTDFKNFTQASEKLTAEELVYEINLCYSHFDKIVEKYHVEKIKTIGDSYMCAGGLPVANTTHAEDVIRCGLEMQEFMIGHKQERVAKGQPYFELRLGIHTGPVVAGIVGIKKFAYDIWGDTVNTASRLEGSGEIGKVNISGPTYELVKDKFRFTYRGKIQAKNKGEIDMYFVDGLI